jgi:hypothetical protein
MQVKFLKSIVIPAIAGGIVFLSSCGDSGEKKAFSNFHPEKEIEKYIRWFSTVLVWVNLPILEIWEKFRLH